MMKPFMNRFAALAFALLLACAPATLQLTPPAAAMSAAAYTAPVASSFSATVPANRQSIVQLQGSDAEATALSFAVVAGPSHGTLTSLNASTGAVVYTPVADYPGADSFTFNVTSGGETSNTATATLSVTNAKTTVTDFFVDAFGAPRRGKVTFVLTQPVTSPSGLVPVGSSVSASLGTGGSFTAQLYPSRSLNPAAYYQVWWTDSSTLKQELIGVYDIPLSTTAVSLAPYKVTDANLAARYTFASVAGLDALTNAVANASLAQLMAVSRTTGRLQYWDGSNLADSLVSQSGSVVTINGSLNVTGALACGSCPSGGSGGGESLGEIEYYRFLNALMEPAAIEPIKRGLYTYTVSAGEYKILLNVWHSALDDTAGRFDIRNPRYFLPVRDVTLRGIYNPGSDPRKWSHAVIINPAAATYSDPKGTYFSRQYQLNTLLKTTSVGLADPGTGTTFATDTQVLCGTYGCIIEQFTNYDTPFAILVTGSGQWLNMADELGDLPQTQSTSAPYTVSGNGVWRFGARPNFPATGYMVAAARIGIGDPETPGVAAKGSITYRNLPPDWPKVADSRTWLFRDDSWGVGTNNANVDLTRWTLFDTTPSDATTGVTISPRFKWHQIVGLPFGDGTATYGTNGMRSTTTFTRAAGLTADFDVSMTDNARCMAGFSKTTGGDIPDWAHALVIDTTTGQYQASIWEDNNLRAQTGGGSMESKRIHHFQITTNADGSATYRVQGPGYTDGSGNLAEHGSAFWHTYTVPGSASAANTFRLVASCQNGTGYFRNLKVSAAPQ